MSGKFYVFEGLDGSGKTYQAKKLAEYLESLGRKVWLTSEPTDSEIGQLIRKILKKQSTVEPLPQALLHLYVADRALHVKEIQEHLSDGEDVICDRYWYSTYAYQGYDGDAKLEILNLNEGFPSPDQVFYIKVPVDVCLERINKRTGTEEIFDKKELLQKIEENYESCWDIYYHPMYRWPTDIDGNKSLEEVTEQIIKELHK